jgi:hypothetical protein
MNKSSAARVAFLVSRQPALSPLTTVGDAWDVDPDARAVVERALRTCSRATVAHALRLTVAEFAARWDHARRAEAASQAVAAMKEERARLGPTPDPEEEWRKALEKRYRGILDRLSKEPDATVGKRYGLSKSYVQMVRLRLKLPSHAENLRARRRDALARAEAQLGKVPDAELATDGVTEAEVRAMRRKHGILSPAEVVKRAAEEAASAFVGTASDADVSERTGLSRYKVRRQRKLRGVAPFGTSPRCPDYQRIDRDKVRELYEKGLSDAEIAEALGRRSPMTIYQVRRQLGLPSRPRAAVPRRSGMKTTTSTTTNYKAPQAYQLRRRGETWPRIAERLRLGDGDAARDLTETYAKEAGLPWPVIQSTRSSTEPAPRAAPVVVTTRQATPAGVLPSRVPPAATPAAAPAFDGPPDAKLAYELRAKGLAWTEAARGARYTAPSNAIAAARAYAKTANKPWPVVVPVDGADVYRRRAACEKWDSISATYNLDSTTLSKAAMAHAKAHNLPWPPVYAAPAVAAPPAAETATAPTPKPAPASSVTHEVSLAPPASPAVATPAPAVAATPPSTLSPPEPPVKLDSKVPLASLNVLSDAFGLSNRKTKPWLVREIATNYDPRAILTLVGLRRRSDSAIFLIDGHHRHEGLENYCRLNGVDPRTFLVRIDIYDEADIPKDTTPAAWIDKFRETLHTRVPESPANEVQRHWSTSPWRPAYAAHGIEPKFNGTMSFNTVVQARLAADTILARYRAGTSAEDCLATFPAPAKSADVVAAQLGYAGPANLEATIGTLLDWEAQVAKKLTRPKHNYRTVTCLTFALLLAEEPLNRRKDLFGVLAAKSPGIPANGVPLLVFAEMLFYANYKKHESGPTRLYILGQSALGPYKKG